MQNESTPLLKMKNLSSSNTAVNPLYKGWKNDKGLLSQLFFSWPEHYVNVGNERPLEEVDLEQLDKEYHGATIIPSIQANIDRTKPKSLLGLFFVIFRSFWATILAQGTLNLLTTIGFLAGPLMIQQLLMWFDTGYSRVNRWWFLKGYAWALAFFAVQLITSFLDIHHVWIDRGILNIKLKTGMIGIIYQKVLKLTSAAVNKVTTGKLVNMINQDVEKISTLYESLSTFMMSIVQLIGCIALLFSLIGWVTFVGIGVIIVLLPIQGIVLFIFTFAMDKAIQVHDDRIGALNEILQGIKIIKFFTWEDQYRQKVEKLRKRELGYSSFLASLYAVTLTIMASTPTLCAVSVFLTLQATKPELLVPTIIFPVLSYFILLKYPLVILPWCLTDLVQGFIALNRIQKFLNLDQVEPVAPYHDYQNPIIIENCTIQYEQGFKLSKINLTVQQGKFVMIVGKVGSGKTTLLEAIVGEIKATEGSIKVSGQIAYCSQQAWIQNKTVLENITFGSPLETTKLNKVLDLCCLTEDLKLFPAGYSTELGEKGYNLSGGQKARISIARAVYKDADIYLLDDPLSALDPNVGKKVFDCLHTHLKNKTRIMTTHHLQYLNFADHIIVLDENGVVCEEGTFEQLNAKEGSLSDLIKKFGIKQDVEEEKVELVDNSKAFIGSAQTVEDQERNYGNVDAAVIWEYIKSFGLLSLVVSIFLYVLCEFVTDSPNWWLSQWMMKPNLRLLNFTDRDFFILYVSFGFGSTIVLFARNIMFMVLGILGGKLLFEKALTRLMRAPMSFFETNLVGRILNRFSTDQNIVDIEITLSLQQILSQIMIMLTTFMIAIYTIPWFVLPLIPILVACFAFRNYFKSPFREMKRVQSLAKAPLYSHYSETILGTSTIRAYGSKEWFVQQMNEKMDLSTRATYILRGLNYWFQLRLTMIANLLVFSAVLLTVVVFHRNPTGVSASLMGLALTYIVQITQTLVGLVENTTEMEASYLNSLERIVHYVHNIPQEAPAITSEATPKNWPHGSIEFKNLSVKYREGLPVILKDLSFSVKQGEKIGIVGRTGSGKSTIILTLFRFMEPCGGTIEIDGVDYLKLGLKTLRGSMAIIPQDPVLFSGTIKSNLDPFGSFSDYQLWEALERSNMKTVILALPNGLDSEIHEGGKNFSVGQRQLLALTRCILTDKKILLMDEATASVDISTDNDIQHVLKSQFAKSTVLTIAHRLHTIVDSDRILVLDKGVIVEYDTPTALKEKKGVFAELLEKEILEKK